MNETRQRRSPVTIALSLALVIALLWPAWLSSTRGLSDLYARPAIDYLETKRFEGYAVSESDWQAIETNVLYANQLMPGNPRYLEALGHLHQLKISLFADEMSTTEIENHANAARDYYLRAIANRPTWPYYWGNLAIEHYRRGRYAAPEYSRALANASRFGPWKNDTQRLVLDLGGETLDFLTPPTKYEFILAVERSLYRQPRNTLRILQPYDVWSEICELVASSAQAAGLPYLQSQCSQQGFGEPTDSPIARNESQYLGISLM